MTKKLLEEFSVFQEKLKVINAQYENIKEDNFEHKKHLTTLREIEMILVDIRYRIDRFYSERYQYRKELEKIASALIGFRVYYGELHISFGLTMDDCRVRIIKILEGMFKELEFYGLPSENDPKFDLHS